MVLQCSLQQSARYQALLARAQLGSLGAAWGRSLGIIILREVKSPMPASSKRSIEQYYAEFTEQERLNSGMGQLEFERTKRILRCILPAPPAVIVDVGGAAGPYSFWLAELGYETHLIDRSQRLVELCRGRILADPQGPCPRSAEVGDARSLAQPDASCDAVLMLGPLYHLVERTDRVQAIREARRILKPGGFVFAATISRFASLIAALCEGLLHDATFLSIVEADLETGQHRNPTDNISFFTDAFFHRNGEIRAELAEGGFTLVVQLPIEGLACMAKDIDSVWCETQSREALLKMLERTETTEEISGLSYHVITVGQKASNG
jgi:ubiquinone/menaquinone biosynthesis C-methylase UbiE